MQKKLYENIQIINSLSKFDGEKLYIATGSLEGSKINFDSAEKITYNDRPSRASQQADSGDLIFAKMQGTDKTLIIDETNKDYIYSSGFFVIRPNKELDKNYLYQFLRSKSFHEQKDKLCTGATQKALTLDGLKKIYFPLPSLATQRTIAEKLDKIQSLIDLKKQSIAKTDDLAKSIFLEMFSDPLRNTKGREMKKLGDICNKITDGTHKTPIYKNEGITFLSAKNISKGFIDLSDIKYLSIKEHKDLIKRSKPERGDILLAKSGTIGIAVLINIDLEFSIFESLALIKYKNEIINGKYLNFFLNSEFARNQYIQHTKGNSIKHLHIIEIKNTSIVLPPLPLQQKFADIIKEIETQKSKHKQALAKLEDLYQAEMQRSFSL